MASTFIFRPYTTHDSLLWKDFVDKSYNGTLFHDLDFLAYHSENRFEFTHLMVFQNDNLFAVIPGGEIEDKAFRCFCSPVGASIGGPVFITPPKSSQAIDFFYQLNKYLKECGFQRSIFTVAPAQYFKPVCQPVEFALYFTGYRMSQKAMPLLLSLDEIAIKTYRKVFSNTRARKVRQGLKLGTTVKSGGIELFSDFVHVFNTTYGRHNATPTHSVEEIAYLLREMSGKIELWLAYFEEKPVSGVLLFQINKQVYNTFYICDDGNNRQVNGLSVLYEKMTKHLAKKGYLYLDLGPSATDNHFNDGVVYFKESLGALPFCRDTWDIDLNKANQ